MSEALTRPTNTAVTPVAGAEELQFDQLLRFGAEMVKTGFLPGTVKTGAQAAAIVLTGRELGIGPMAALRSINIVQGRPVIAADLLLGLFKQAGGKAEISCTADTAKAVFTHPNGDTATEIFNLEDAKRAGLLGKDNWRNYPKAMLRSRVITAGLKTIGWTPAAGVYDPDEIPAPSHGLRQLVVTAAPAPPPEIDTDTGAPFALQSDPIPAPAPTPDEMPDDGYEPPGTLEPPTLTDPLPEPPPVHHGGAWDTVITDKQVKRMWALAHAWKRQNQDADGILHEVLSALEIEHANLVTRGTYAATIWGIAAKCNRSGREYTAATTPARKPNA